MGRNIFSEAKIKNKVKKVDRLENNKQLHEELSDIYAGLSNYIFKYLSHNKTIPIIVDLCFMKDDHDIQMLSAEVTAQGRSMPVYREVFASGGLKNRAKYFLANFSTCLPTDSSILIIMDAGFGEEWFSEIQKYNWHWLTRIRQGKKLKLGKEQEWQNVLAIIPEIGEKAKAYNDAAIMKGHDMPCRIVTIKQTAKVVRKKPKKAPRNDKAGNNSYRRAANEPWILATNLPITYGARQIINYYAKRMQIEESFRDLKSHQYGLSARYVRTTCIYRWGVKMLLAAIVQIIYWIIGIIGHSLGMQKICQANTVKDRKVFSYFYLGKLIIEFNKINELKFDDGNIDKIIEQELARKW